MSTDRRAALLPPVRSELRGNAKLALAKLPAELRQQHADAWARTEPRIEAVALTTKVNGKKPLSFEVHHMIEHARELYWSELANGMPSDHCERTVLSAYGIDSQ